MSITDQKRRVATDEDCKRSWGLRGPSGFRCYLCGHKFKAGDGYRWVYSAARGLEIDGKKFGVTNLLTCDSCDGPDILDRWVARNEEFNAARFWALH